MAQEDRLEGLLGNSAIKVPVICATTANITLSGEQSIDGITTSASRVLVKNQTTTTENGIYLSDSGAWSLAPDSDGPYDWVFGSLVFCASGSTNGGAVFKQTTTGTITPGTSSLAFSSMGLLSTPVPIASGGTSGATAIAGLAALGVIQVTAEAGTNTATGTVDALVTALRADQLFIWVPANTNTGALTLELTPSGGASLTAKNVFWNGAACVGGEARGAVPVLLQYDGTQLNIIGVFPIGFLTTKGDMLVATASATVARLGVGAAGTIPMSRAAATTGLAYVAALVKSCYGWAYANNVADAVNDIDIPVGGGMDATGAYWITTAALTKQSDVAWAVGSAAGGLDTGAVGNSDYYIWAIARSDTGVTDILFSLSSTAPTTPANYDFKRLMGWFKRVGGTIVAFHTYETQGGGIELNWDVPTLDINLAATLTTTRRTDAPKVPLNISTIANLNVQITDAAADAFVWICCPDQTDAAPSLTVAPLASVGQFTTSATTGARNMSVRTSAAGLIAARANIATVDLYAASTMGFSWARRT